MKSDIEDKVYSLMWHLSNDEEFRQRLDRVPNRSLFESQPWSFISAVVQKLKSFPVNITELDGIKDYYDAVGGIAEDYHLPPEWGAEAIHRWSFSMARGFAVSPFRLTAVDVEISAAEDKPFIEVQMLIRPFARWADVERALSEQKSMIMDSLERRRAHHRLEYHLMWLARRLATRETYEKIADWHQKCFPDKEAIGEDTVRKGVHQVGDILGIDPSGI